MKGTLLERSLLYPGFLSRHYDELHTSHSKQMPQKAAKFGCVLLRPVCNRGKLLGEGSTFRLYLCFHGRDIPETLYSDTSANEDNSFRNHIR